jgi:hypothetical protein
MLIFVSNYTEISIYFDYISTCNGITYDQIPVGQEKLLIINYEVHSISLRLYNTRLKCKAVLVDFDFGIRRKYILRGLINPDTLSYLFIRRADSRTLYLPTSQY